MATDLNRTATNPKFDPRLIAFHNLVIHHPMLDALLAELDVWLHLPRPYLLYVIGPTGVGKTTVRKILDGRYRQEAAGDPNYPAGWLPVAGYRTIAPSNGKFDNIANYRRALANLGEPLIDYKTHRPQPGLPRTRLGGTRRENDFRESVVSAIAERHVDLFWVDEAQHMAKAGSGKSALEHADLFKSLQDDVKIPVLLFGAYDLYDLSTLHGQLIRRSKALHFRRYRIDDESEAAQFINVINTFQRRLPLPCDVDLVRRVEVCYQETLGCVGLLQQWLERALLRAIIADPNGPLTWQHLTAARRTRDERRVILDAILVGEGKFNTRRDATTEDDALMGLEEFRRTHAREDGTVPTTPIATAKRPRKHLKPGERYPRRYRIGLRMGRS